MHNYLPQNSAGEKTLLSLTVTGLPDVYTEGSDVYVFTKLWDIPTCVLRAESTVQPTFFGVDSTPLQMAFYTTNNGEYSIIGYEYVDSVTEIEIPNLNISQNVKENVKIFDKFTVYAKDQNGSCEFKKQQIQKYISSRGTVSAKVVLNGEKVGDLITIETAFSGVITGIITAMNLMPSYSNVAEIEVLEWVT